MNQLATLELFAGGPGSGCRGDNCGRPSKGKQRETKEKFVVFYHGTSVEGADRIKKEGILKSKAKMKTVDVTDIPHRALDYGDKLVVVKVPESLAKKFVNMTSDGPDWAFNGNIPPQFIHEVVSGDLRTAHRLEKKYGTMQRSRSNEWE